MPDYASVNDDIALLPRGQQDDRLHPRPGEHCCIQGTGAGDDRGGLCGGVCGEAVIHGVPAVRLRGFV